MATTALSYDVARQRAQFPALARRVGSHPAAFLDGPAGSQAPAMVIEAISRYLTECNANHGGVFATSVESDERLDEAHRAAADFVGAHRSDEVYFGANMTSLTFALSRALAKSWRMGDQIIVTRLDHDANVTPWVMAARDAGASVEHVAINPADCTLDLDDFQKKLNSRTRLVAVTCASNATGTINPVREIIELAHRAGSLVFLDAVHYAPHALPDVTAWNCDFLACSAYKFFGPHVGMIWGRQSLLTQLPAYKVRPATETLPGRWMTGTQNHEGITGVQAAIDYLAELGRHLDPQATHRRGALAAAYRAIRTYEEALLTRLLDGLARLPSIKVYGITDPDRYSERVATIAFRHARKRPVEVATFLAERGIFVWHGNYYALPLTEALGLEPDGMVRVGLLHYNTLDEVERLLAALGELE